MIMVSIMVTWITKMIVMIVTIDDKGNDNNIFAQC